MIPSHIVRQWAVVRLRVEQDYVTFKKSHNKYLLQISDSISRISKYNLKTEKCEKIAEIFIINGSREIMIFAVVGNIL